MFQSLKDLLPDALRRGHLSREMAATQIVEIFNQWIVNFLPSGRAQDAQAVSYKDKILNINCRNMAAAHWLTQHEQEIVSALSQRSPETPIIQIKIRLSQANNFYS
jgi:predicted nucleic acid-binding Zn ribbon protein